MLYKAAYLYGSGGIQCGDCIYAQSDRDAAAMAHARAKCKHAEVFGLHEVTGIANNGVDLIRPVRQAP